MLAIVTTDASLSIDMPVYLIVYRAHEMIESDLQRMWYVSTKI
jgi:hypothetical protein